MMYLAIYLAIGALTFYPMLLWDKECAQYLRTNGWKYITGAFLLWSTVWALSIFYDLCDWLFPEDAE